MAWRAAYSLQTLRSQLDTNYLGWLFLGYYRDPNIRPASDHHPNAASVVCALDIGLGGGLDIHKLADNIVANPHPDLKYIISNRRIAEWQYGFKWRTYSGSDPHDTHIHISVGRGSDGQSVQPYDDRVQWNIKGESVVDNNIVKKEDLDLLRIIASEIEGWDYNDTHAGKNDELLLKTFVGLPFKTITRNMFHNPNSAAYREKKVAAFSGSEFKPYDGSQLYLKK